MSGRENIIGFVTQSLTPANAEAISESPVPIGTYVYADFLVRDRRKRSMVNRRVVGVVTNVGYQPAMPLSTLSLLREDVEPEKLKTPKYSPMSIYVIADVSEGEASTPIYPIPPNTPLQIIDSGSLDVLSYVYKRPDPSRGLIRIGSLARIQEIDVAVEANKLFKHLLITGATGSGKSNAVAVIADRLSSIGAPVIIFDVHGEYVNMTPEEGSIDKVVIVKAEINPLTMRPDVLSHIIIRDPQATKQRRYLKRILISFRRDLVKISREKNIGLETAVEELFNIKMMTYANLFREYAEDLFNIEDLSELSKLDQTKKMILLLLLEIYLRAQNADSSERRVYEGIEDRLTDFIISYPILNIYATDVLEKISPGKIVVYDVSVLTDDQKAWVLRILADNLLERLKTRYREVKMPPTVLVVEEAPLFISSTSPSVARESLKRFAREGRKFGGVLIIVSQRPRTLDPDISSQIQNFLFLKLVQQEDIKNVMSIADNLEESLARTLPSLPTGWGILMGEWIGRFPALVAIDRHPGKRLGASPDLVSEWRDFSEKKERKDLMPSEFQF